MQEQKPPTKLEAKPELENINGKYKSRSGSLEQEWGIEKNPNEGVRYFARGAQTLLTLVREGP